MGKYKIFREIHFRDASRFSEDWPGPAVVGFGSVTVSVCLSSRNDSCSVPWLGYVHPVPDFYIRYRTGPCDVLTIGIVGVSGPRRLGDFPCLDFACWTASWALPAGPSNTPSGGTENC